MPSSQKSKDYDFPLYLFHQGKNFEAYRFFGAHLFRRGRGQFCRFRVWAPHAKSVSVIGHLPFRYCICNCQIAECGGFLLPR